MAGDVPSDLGAAKPDPAEPVLSLDGGRITTIPGADFCFGIGTDLKEAEVSLKRQKEIRKASR